MFRGIIAVLGVGLVVWLGLNLIIAGNLFTFKFWAPEFRDAQREVFEQSQSYVQGKETYLARLRLQYETAEEGPQRESLRRMILTEASTVDGEDLSEGLQEFLAELEKGEQE